MIQQSDIQKLIELPIEGVAERLGLRVIRHISLCPFHDDHHSSLHFNVSKNRYRCYVCGAHGRTIDLVSNYLHLSFPDTCKWLADGTNVIIEEYKAKALSSSLDKNVPRSPISSEHFTQLIAQPVLTQEAQRFLFEERKLNRAVINWCGISSTHTHLLIPYFDADGSLKSIQWRYLGRYANPQLPNEPRFRFPKGSQCSIYNLQILKLLKPSEPLYIAEGCSDCWALLSAGHKAIAIPSATLLKPSDLKILSTLSSQLSTEYHMFPDDDNPGERLFLQIREISPHVTRHQLPAGCKDYSDYYCACPEQLVLSQSKEKGLKC